MNREWTKEQIHELLTQCSTKELDENGLEYEFQVYSQDEGMAALLIPLASEKTIYQCVGTYTESKPGEYVFCLQKELTEYRVEDYLALVTYRIQELEDILMEKMKKHKKISKWFDVYKDEKR